MQVANHMVQKMIKDIFNTFFLSLAIISQVHFAYAQTASILPPAETTFFDVNGNPLSSGTVNFYIPNTTTPKTTWKDSAETLPNTNPVVLDAGGRAIILGQGFYRQIVKDSANNVVWDQVTASAGAGSVVNLTGDGDAVGTIKAFAGMTAPNQYMLTFGQEVSRTAFAALLTAITSSQGVFCTSGSPIISGLSDTTNFWVGMGVELSCVSGGTTTVLSKTSTTITLVANANVTTNTTAVFFPWGRGNGSSTFNLPDLRGLAVVGNNNMGGAASSNLTSQFFGATNPNSSGAAGGQQSIALGSINLPSYTPSGTISVPTIAIANGSGIQASGGGASPFSPGAGNAYSLTTLTATAGAQTFTGTPNGGSATPFPNITPSKTANYIIKVTPDTNPGTPNGVTSLGSMTGDIACGTGLTCAGNIISSNQPKTNPNGIIYASNFGVKCDGVTDDSAAMRSAVNAANGATVMTQAGTCIINSQVFSNKFSNIGGTLTVPGMSIAGAGKGVTIFDTRVSDFMFAVNPAWKGAHQALFGATAGIAGALTTNTYFLQITMNDGLGNEIFVTKPKSIAVVGPNGSVSVTLPATSPGYSYNIYFDTNSTPAHLFASGAAPQTFVIPAVSGTNIVAPTTNLAIWQQANFSDFSIINSTATANASGILLFKVGYSNVINTYLKNLTGDGILLTAYQGDLDGSFVVTIDKNKFDTIAGSCVNAAGNVLELSNLTVTNNVFNLCGTSPAAYGVNFTILNITNAAGGIIQTSSASGWANNDIVAITGVTGMTLANALYRVTVVDPTHFNLLDLNSVAINTTALGAYNASSGTGNMQFRAPVIAGGIVNGSCALTWTGLIGYFANNGFTQNKNCSMYFSEAGGSDNVTIINNDFENTYGVGLYIASLQGGFMYDNECLSTASLGPTAICVLIGTGTSFGGAVNFKIAGPLKVRSDVTPAIAYAQVITTNVGATYYNNNLGPLDTTWQNWDNPGQTRFFGFVFPPVPGQVQFSISGTNTLKLTPIGTGGCVPLHLVANGEWRCFQVPSTGTTASVTGGLSANTVFNCYISNSAANLFPYVLAAECVATGTVLDQGYKVESGATQKTFVGTAATDGAGNFQTTGAQTSWYAALTHQAMPLTMGTVPTTQASTFFTIMLGNATEANIQALCPVNGGTFSNLQILSSAPAAGQTLTATWRVANADTSLACVVTGVGTTCSNLSNSATCTTGQPYALKLVTSATTGSLASVSGSVELRLPN